MTRRKVRPIAVLAWALAVLFAVAAGAPSARADGTADEAELHFRMGARDFARGDYEGALAHFMHSNRLAPNRNVLFNIATAFEQLKRYVDAHRYYVEALEGETDPKARAAVGAGLARLTPNVAVLDVETTPPGATLYIDRKDLGSHGKAPRPLALLPGRYRVIAELDGYDPAASAPVDVAVGSEKKVALTLVRIVGTVRISVEGASSAAVHVDDERAPPACYAPCDLDLPPGPHLLSFTAEGFRAEPRPVTVVARAVTSTSAVLRPFTGSIVIEADERGAVVKVDGKPSGFTPAVIQGVAVGRRRVRVELRGYTPVEIEVDVHPDRSAQPDPIKLVPLREVIAVSRYKESIDDAPSSVTILSADEIAAFGYPTIASALQGVRGFSISNDRAYASAGVRGLGQPDDYGNRLLVLSDGHSLNDNIANSSAIGSDARVDLHDVDRIEVVRGPGSLLYGTGAFSGVVNLVSRPRDEDNSVHVGFGVYDDAAIHGRMGFHYNFKEDKSAGVWASVSAAHSDGYDLTVPGVLQPDGTTRLTQTAHQVEDFTSVDTAGRVWWGPITLQWYYNHRDQIVPVGAYGTPFDDPRTTLGDTHMMTELRVEPRIGKLVELLVRAHANRSISHEAFSALAPTSPTVEDYTGTWFGTEARVVVTPISWLRLTGGGELQADVQASMHGVDVDASGAPQGAPYIDEEHPYLFGAGYVLGEVAPRPWVRIVAGARADVYSTFGTILVPRAAVVFKPTAGGVLKVMGGRAFRAPSVYEQFYHSPGFEEVADDAKLGEKLGPESIYSGEIEYSQRFLEDWVALGSVYTGYVQGLIETITDSNTGLIRYANTTNPALLAGADVEIRREFRRGWMLSASYGYEWAGDIGTVTGDRQLVNAPEHMASLKGIVPVIREIVSTALRLTLEAPRRISAASSATTGTGLIADAAVSGSLRDYGLRYVVGVYNIAGVREQLPVSSTFLSSTLPTNGRTFIIDLVGTYPPR